MRFAPVSSFNPYIFVIFGASPIEVTPLATFIERYPFIEGMPTKIDAMIQSIQHDIILQLPIGSKVVVCNIQSKPKLNGRAGVIGKSSKKHKVSIDRIPVLIEGENGPVQLKPKYIQLPIQNKKPLYRSLQEIRHEHDIAIEQEQEETPTRTMTQEEVSRTQAAIHSGPAVTKAMSVISTGQMSFTSLGDPEIKRGITMIVIPPLDAILPAPLTKRLKDGIELSNHPKADDAMEIISMMKAGKQRFAQDHPSLINNDGSIMVLPGSDMSRMQKSIVKKIRSDKELYFVFQRLEELGLYVNPAK